LSEPRRHHPTDPIEGAILASPEISDGRTLLLNRLIVMIVCTAAVVAGCVQEPSSGQQPLADTSFDETRLLDHVRVLASDEFEGRGLASAGEEKTIDYIVSRFIEYGLQPGFGDSYVQDVPLIRTQTRPGAKLVVRTRVEQTSLGYGSEVVFWTRRAEEAIELAGSELVFAGYGVVAPEYGWDDYAGLDARGKTVVVLINDPGLATQDPALFNGRNMTYYGRWTYKFEEAARQGASAALIIHQTEPAAYGWEVVSNTWTRPQYDLDRGDGNVSRLAVEGWITRAAAAMVLQAAGKDLDSLSEQAAQKGFRPIPLGVDVDVTLNNAVDKMVSRNVGAVIPGATRPDESILLSAHWDHLGIDPGLEGDRIYNGAKDNATGVAALLELARVAAGRERPLARSLFFASFTAEESQLLGSLYFAENSPLPLATMVGVLNIDIMNVWGPTRDVQVKGHGSSQLENYLADAARSQDRRLVADPFAEKGYYYRSDHFSMARFGVPGLLAGSGTDYTEHGNIWGRERDTDYVSNRYHKPSDEIDPAWDLSGAMLDMDLYLQVALRLAGGNGFPQWADGNQFKAVRDQTAASRMHQGSPDLSGQRDAQVLP
jgi:Zn-dependent M28 family amino/carboxypeptidase